jgi:hypothetical protein
MVAIEKSNHYSVNPADSKLRGFFRQRLTGWSTTGEGFTAGHRRLANAANANPDPNGSGLFSGRHSGAKQRTHSRRH